MSIDLADDECIHGLTPKSSCTICSGKDHDRDIAAANAPATFPAKYETICPECRRPIRIGDTVAWKEGARAFHEGCWPS